ncbi:MAG: GTPase [Thermoprotei archaeon]
MKCVIGYVKTDVHDHILYKLHIEDLSNMARSIGYEPVGVVIQTMPKENVSFLFGSGKVNELKTKIREDGIEALILYNIMNSIQKLNLERMLNVKVLDRYDLTLEIFDQNASDKISKLQIELAKLLKFMPYEKLKASIRYFKNKPGPKSSGEYAYHKTIGQLKRRINQLENEIEHARIKRYMQLKQRRSLGLPIIALSGYYGAGKTTLFNNLTNLRRPALGKPFTTLSSKYYLCRTGGKRYLLIDTIGFATGLDPRMIHSFRLTLDDIRLSDSIISVIDISDQPIILKYRTQTVASILKELSINMDKIVIAANKIDLLDEQIINERIEILKQIFNPAPIIPISAQQKINIKQLIQTAINISKKSVDEKQIEQTRMNTHY